MFWGVHRSLERSSDRLHEPGVFRRREVTVLGVWADWPTRRRIAVVPGHEVTVQVGNRISEQLVIQLVGLEEAIERLGASNAVLEVPGAFVLRQFVRFADMALADQHAVALDALVAAEPQAAKVQVRDGMPILVATLSVATAWQSGQSSPRTSASQRWCGIQVALERGNDAFLPRGSVAIAGYRSLTPP